MASRFRKELISLLEGLIQLIQLLRCLVLAMVIFVGRILLALAALVGGSFGVGFLLNRYVGPLAAMVGATLAFYVIAEMIVWLREQ